MQVNSNAGSATGPDKLGQAGQVFSSVKQGCHSAFLAGLGVTGHDAQLLAEPAHMRVVIILVLVTV